MASDQPSSKKDAAILAEARERFKRAEEAESETRRLALEDLKFRAGDQWPEGVKAERERDGRPCLTINKTEQQVLQVTNDQRQNRPSIKVSPVDDLADPDTAEVIQGIIRNIEYSSDAETAYDTAFEGAVDGGFGYFRIITDYVDPRSFEQEVKIKRIRNRFSVYFDPFSQEPDGSDACYAFIVDDLSKDEFKSRYPNAKLSTTEDWASVGDRVPEWVKKDGCRIAEYYYRELEPETLVLLSGPNDETVVQLERDLDESLLPEGWAILDERETQIPVVHWCKINGHEILEKTTWVGSYIPIIPVYGNEMDIEGKRVLSGVIRHAKDPQRMYNYWASAETEAIALAPKAPFIAAEGQLEGYEKEWETANSENHAYLTYKPITLGGKPVPPPQRNVAEAPVQAITQARMLSSEDLKATTGIYDASLGAQSNETSGIAIQRRNMQAQTSNFHFVDNLTRSMKHAGRILVEIIPKIYDTARMVRIIGQDGEEKIVRVNAQFEEDGKLREYRLGAGKYDVTVDVGPSFASKRQEAVQAMLEVTRVYPALAQVAGDLMVKNMDWPGAQEISERLKKMLPPNLMDEGAEIPPQAQAQITQAQELIERLTNELNDAQSQIESDSIKAEADLRKEQMKLESDERIAFAKIDHETKMTLAKMESAESIELLRQELSNISERLKLLDISEPVGPEPLPSPELETPTGGQTPGIPMDGDRP